MMRPQSEDGGPMMQTGHSFVQSPATIAAGMGRKRPQKAKAGTRSKPGNTGTAALNSACAESSPPLLR